MKRKTKISEILAVMLLLAVVAVWAAVFIVAPVALLKLCIMFLFA